MSPPARCTRPYREPVSRCTAAMAGARSYGVVLGRVVAVVVIVIEHVTEPLRSEIHALFCEAYSRSCAMTAAAYADGQLAVSSSVKLKTWQPRRRSLGDAVASTS